MTRSWSVLDFVLIWLGGLVGTGAFFAISLAVENENWTIVLSLAGQYVGNLGVLWILSRYKDTEDIGLAIEGGDFVYIGLGLILQIGLALVYVAPMTDLIFPDDPPRQEIADIIANADTTFLTVSLIAAAVVLGPVTEELMYRGVLLRSLQRWGNWLAIVLSSVVFAAVHLAGLEPEQRWQSALVFLPPLFVLGLILAWLTQRKGRLGPAIFLHSGWNLLSAFVLLLPTDVLTQVG